MTEVGHDADPHRLVVGVTGHRDLVASELERLRERTRALFQSLMEDYPWARVTVMSPLAEGADTLVAEVAVELELDLVVPLPKSVDECRRDLSTDEDRRRFDGLSKKARMVFEVEGEAPPPPKHVDPERWAADFPYARLGIYLSAHCHILLAIWDGDESDSLGGTAQVVRFHQDDVMPGVTSVTVATHQMLVDDESDLVYHIVCSRRGREHEWDRGYRPGDAFWYTKDASQPRSDTLPGQHELIFRRQGEFSEDARRFEARIAREAWSLLSSAPERFAQEVQAIDRLFGVADWLAIHYQRRTLWTLRTTYAFAFLTGLMFILYTDFATSPLFLVGFLAAVSVAAGARFMARRGGWHRRYLDYRALAEGLRVQTYWAVGGVVPKASWKFAHDLYLRGQKPEFGWIRNLMRVAGFGSGATRVDDGSGVSFAIDEWVGDEAGGQLAYFRRKARERRRHHAQNERIGQLALAVSVLTVLIFTFGGSQIPDQVVSELTVIMGASLLVFAVREGYAHATAVKELINQYEHMLRMYENARRRLTGANTIAERRQILLALGQSALDEHSDWLLTHRERLFEDVKLWRIGG